MAKYSNFCFITDHQNWCELYRKSVHRDLKINFFQYRNMYSADNEDAWERKWKPNCFTISLTVLDADTNSVQRNIAGIHNKNTNKGGVHISNKKKRRLEK